MTLSKSRAIALSLAAAVTMTAAPAFAAPVLSSTVTVKEANPGQVTEIQWRGRRGGAVAAGAAVGFLAGAAIGAAASQPRYYDPGYAYYEPAPSYYYSQPAPTYYYEPAPTYYAQPYAYAYAPAPMYQAPCAGRVVDWSPGRTC